MRISVNWFTFGPDGESLLVSMASVKAALPSAALHVWDDSQQPLSWEHRQRVVELGGIYEATAFNRRKNLNGRECILGEIDCFKRSGGDVIFKVDCDTLLLRAGRFVDAFQEHANVLGVGIRCPKTNGFWGPCYAYRSEVLEPMAEGMKKKCGCCPHPEDLAMSGWLRQAAPARMRIFDFEEKGGAFAGYNYRTELTLAEYARRYDVITFGARFLIPARGAEMQRAIQAATMQRAWGEFRA